MYKVKQFFRRIYNLYRWFPIIWKDQDWDHTFIFEILKFKLKNQAEYIGSKDRHMSAKRDAEIMMLCVRLIDKVQDEHYGREYQGYYKSDMRFVPSESHPGSYEMDVEILEENFDDYFKKYPRIYKQVMSTEEPPFKKEKKEGIAMNIAHTNEERVNKLLFKILEQNIQRWWD